MSEQESSEQEGSEQEPALDAEVTDEDATEITGGRIPPQRRSGAEFRT